MTDRPWRIVDDRLVVRVRLTPRAARDSVDGIVDTPFGPALEARVRAVPDKGEANAALEELIARTLKQPRRMVAVTGGLKSRVKSVTVAGEARVLAARLASACDEPS